MRGELQPRINHQSSLDAFLDSEDEDDRPVRNRPSKESSSKNSRATASATLNKKGPVVASSSVLDKANDLLKRAASPAPRGASPNPLGRGHSPSPAALSGGGGPARPQSASARRPRSNSRELNPGDLQRNTPTINLVPASPVGSRAGSPVASPRMNKREVADEYGGTAKLKPNPMTSIGPAIPGVGAASPSMGGSRQNSLRGLGGRDASPAPPMRGLSPAPVRGRAPSTDKRTNEMGFTVDAPAPAMTSIGPGLSAMPTTQGKAMGSRAPSRGLSPVPSPSRGASPAPLPGRSGPEKLGEAPLAGIGRKSGQSLTKLSPGAPPAQQGSCPPSPSMSSRGGNSMTSIGPGPLVGSRQGSNQSLNPKDGLKSNISMTSIGPLAGGRPNSAAPFESKANPGGLSMLDVPKLQGMGSRQASLSSLADENGEKKSKKDKKDKKEKKHRKNDDDDDDPMKAPLKPMAPPAPGLLDIPKLQGMGSKSPSMASLLDGSDIEDKDKKGKKDKKSKKHSKHKHEDPMPIQPQAPTPQPKLGVLDVPSLKGMQKDSMADLSDGGADKKDKKDKKEKKSKKHGKHEEEFPLRPQSAPLNSLDHLKLSRQPSLESLMSDRSEMPLGSEKKSKKDKKEKKSKKHAKQDEEFPKDKNPLPLRPPTVLNALDKEKKDKKNNNQKYEYDSDELLDGTLDGSLDDPFTTKSVALMGGPRISLGDSIEDLSDHDAILEKKSKKEKKEKKSKGHPKDVELDNPFASKSVMGGPIELGDSLEDLSDQGFAVPEKKSKKEKKEKKNKKHAKDDESFDSLEDLSDQELVVPEKKGKKDKKQKGHPKKSKKYDKDDESFDSLLDSTDFGHLNSNKSKLQAKAKDKEAEDLDERRMSDEIEEVMEPQVPTRPQSAKPTRPQSAKPTRPEDSDSRGKTVQGPPTNTARPFAGRSVTIEDDSIEDDSIEVPSKALASTMASSGGLSSTATAPASKMVSSGKIAAPEKKARPQTAPPRPQPERPQSSAGGVKIAHKALGLRVSKFLLCFEPPVLAVDWGKDPKLMPPDVEKPEKTRTHIEFSVDELVDLRDRAQRVVLEHDFLSSRHLWAVEGLLRQLAARSLPVYRVVREKGAVLQEAVNDPSGWGQVPHLPRGALVLARERARQMNGWWIKVWSGHWMQECCTEPGAEEVTAERCNPPPSIEEVGQWLKNATQMRKPMLEQNASAVAKQAGLKTEEPTVSRRPGTAPPREQSRTGTLD